MKSLFVVLLMLSIPSFAEEVAKESLSEQLVAILGKPKDDPAVLKICKDHGLREYSKGESGGFSGPLETIGFSLLYRESKIQRIVIRVSNAAEGKNWATFDVPLPFGLQKTDSSKDVIKKLGEPKARPEPEYDLNQLGRI